MTEDGFASFFRERFGRTVVLLITLGASRADAEDAAQGAMTEAWEHWEGIRQPAAWLPTVAVREYWKLVRARQQTVSLDESALETVVGSDLSIFAEEQQLILRVFRLLPPEQRTVLALYYDGLNCKEIAVLTGKLPATIRSHLRYARKTLKELMS